MCISPAGCTVIQPSTDDCSLLIMHADFKIVMGCGGRNCDGTNSACRTATPPVLLDVIWRKNIEIKRLLSRLTSPSATVALGCLGQIVFVKSVTDDWACDSSFCSVFRFSSVEDCALVDGVSMYSPIQWALVHKSDIFFLAALCMARWSAIFFVREEIIFSVQMSLSTKLNKKYSVNIYTDLLY